MKCLMKKGDKKGSDYPCFFPPIELHFVGLDLKGKGEQNKDLLWSIMRSSFFRDSKKTINNHDGVQLPYAFRKL